MRRQINRSRLAFALALVVAVGLSGCPRSGASTDSGAAEEPAAPKSRFSGDTKAFFDELQRIGVSTWTVADDGAAVVYEAVEFAEDGAFSADVTVRIGEEPFTCRESGTWALDRDRASSASVGLMNFEMTETNCAGREAPQSWRAELTITDDDVLIELR